MAEVDEYHGQGGTYVIDPETGKRTRVVEPTAIPFDGERKDQSANTNEEGGE